MAIIHLDAPINLWTQSKDHWVWKRKTNNMKGHYVFPGIKTARKALRACKDLNIKTKITNKTLYIKEVKNE